jgi:uncharacterized Zn finger protein
MPAFVAFRELGVQDFVFEVVGSQGDPYRVTFAFNGDKASASCTCGAGEQGKWCKHRTALLDGDVTAVRSANASEVAALKDRLAGTSLGAAYSRWVEAEEGVVSAKKTADAAKRALARVATA